jgi:hypothetical protein
MKYYLAKNGEILGPLSLKEIESMQARRELDKFSYIWDPKKKLWNAIDASPSVNPEETVVDIEKASPSQKAYCMIHDEIVRGKLEGVTGFGCRFISSEDWMTPPIAPRSLVSLILCEAQGVPQELPMRVGSIERTAQGWVLHLRKDEMRRFG